MIDAEVDRIRSLGIGALRTRWRAMFNVNPPTGLTKDILGRMIAYRIQEEAFGDLDRDTIKILGRFARGDRPGELNRRLKPGTVLIREHKGERHTVTISPDGFIWQGTTYSSLSTIARTITGTAWNGPRFFGLRMREAKTVSPVSQAHGKAPRADGRSKRRSSVPRPLGPPADRD